MNQLCNILNTAVILCGSSHAGVISWVPGSYTYNFWTRVCQQYDAWENVDCFTTEAAGCDIEEARAIAEQWYCEYIHGSKS